MLKGKSIQEEIIYDYAGITPAYVVAVNGLKQKLKYIGISWIEFLVMASVYDMEQSREKHHPKCSDIEYIVGLLGRDRASVYKTVKRLIDKEYLESYGKDLPFERKTLLLAEPGRRIFLDIRHGRKLQDYGMNERFQIKEIQRKYFS